MDANQKKPATVALLALGVLFIGGIVFYKERLFFADAAFYAFNIINNKGFSIMHERYGAFITQLFPYIGQKLHLPLRVNLIGFACGFNLFYLVIASLLVYRYKQYGLAILMGLYYFLFVSDSYFWLNDEIHQAVAWMFLLLGVTLYMGYKKVNILFVILPFLLLAFLTVSTHFVVIIPLVFLWVYLILEKEKWPFSGNITILLSSLLAIVIFIKYSATAGKQSYDGNQLRGLTHFSLKDLINTFSTPVLQAFFHRCLVNYWVSVLVFIAGIVSLIIRKQKMLAAWTIISCIGYILVMGLIYGGMDSSVLLFHIETEWQCIGIIVAAPFVFTFLPTLRGSFAIGLLAIVFATRLVYIGSAIPKFSWRIQFQERLLAQMKKKNITKLALYDDFPEQKNQYLLDWAAGYESLFTSALSGDKPNRTFIFINRDDKQTMEAISGTKNFYNVWSMLPPNEINSTYFITDTVHAYQIMTYDELIK